jgi:hypothetical protein
MGWQWVRFSLSILFVNRMLHGQRALTPKEQLKKAISHLERAQGSVSSSPDLDFHRRDLVRISVFSPIFFLAGAHVCFT